MLQEIVEWKYKTYGFPYVFMDYSQTRKMWSITWRNPISFINDESREGKTPREACENALNFIKSNPSFFSKTEFD